MRNRNASLTRSHPFFFYAILFFGLTLAGTLILWWILKWDIVLSWLVAITPVTLLAYRFDKWLAGTDHLRVPERVLLLLTLAGGTLGAIAGMWFIGQHHKTSKTSFILPFLGILVMQAILVGVYVWIRFHGS
ncbi:MAG TPA: DUF1294 domain-containing protein [Anaerolineae bacterium]|nr:DUF1294 domain-containing protein [Anaerolineae bacterium]